MLPPSLAHLEKRNLSQRPITSESCRAELAKNQTEEATGRGTDLSKNKGRGGGVGGWLVAGSGSGNPAPAGHEGIVPSAHIDVRDVPCAGEHLLIGGPLGRLTTLPVEPG